MSDPGSPMTSYDHSRFTSLRTKFVAFLSLILIATSSGLSWYFIENKRAEMTDRLTALGSILVRTLAHNELARLAIIAGDKRSLVQFTDGVTEVDEVIYIRITDADGNVLASKSKGSLATASTLTRSPDHPLYPDLQFVLTLLKTTTSDPQITHFKSTKEDSAPLTLDQKKAPPFIPTTIDSETFYDFALPVLRRSSESRLETFALQSEESSTPPANRSPETVGLVQIGLTEVQLQRALASTIWNIALLTIVVIAAGIVGTLFLADRIIKPLRSLATVARQIAEGDLTASVIPTTRDEVGQLTTLFNLMTLSLAERNKAISANLETIKKQITHLTTLNQASAAITSTLDLNTLFSTVLELLIHNLGFSRMLLVLYDSERGVASIGQVAGVSAVVEQAARQIEIPVQDDCGTDADMLLRGNPLLVHDIDAVAHRMYPPVLALARQAGVISFIGVPLRSQQRVLGYLAADRGAQPCSQEDLDLLMTVASHVAVAIDNARAYSELGTLTQHLEQRVEERTRELQSANERLQEHDRRRTKFVSVASHELRTPMTSIRGFVENMLDGLTGSITERQTHYLNRVKHNVERLTRIINQLLDWSRIDIKRLELSLEPVSLDDLITDVVESLQTVAAEKGVLLAIKTPESHLTVRADRDKLEQILWNLLGNALKFTPREGHVSVALTVRADGFVEVCVADTGCGIAPHELSTVFEEFSKVESTLPGSQGAQLGLFITRSLVMLHGGEIWVDSTLGAGSRFCFTIPMPDTRREA